MDLLNKEQQLQFKQQLKQQCLALLQSRIDAIETAMREAQDAANSEEKSSAGDKYETGRAMNQLNKEMYAAQLEEALKELAQLNAANTDALSIKAGPGALIITSQHTIFIAAAIGPVHCANEKVMVLSPHAPLAIALAGKKSGDALSFNGKPLQIETLF